MATSSASESEPSTTPDTPVESAAVVEPAASEALVAAESAAADAPAAEQPSATPAAAAQPTVVFVTAPQPPKKRGARGVGAVVALLSAGVFTAVYASLVLLLGLIEPRYGIAGALETIASVTFYLPVIIFFLAYLLLVVVINGAGWWAHVLGGFIVAVVVWVGFVGAAIIAAGAFGGSAAEVNAVVLQQLTNPLGFVAAIAAREVPIWVGGLVSRRGRTARARNVEARAAYEQALAEHRATVGGATAV
jgi:hypothetical protein